MNRFNALLLWLAACAQDNDTGINTWPQDTGKTGETGDTTDTADTALAINECAIYDFDDANDDGIDDNGDIAIEGACLLQEASELVGGNGTIKLFGGTATFFGGLTVASSDKITLNADSSADSTIVTGDAAAPIITVQNGGQLYVNGNDHLVLDASGEAYGIVIEPGGSAYASYTEFHDLGTDVYVDGGLYSEEGVTHTLVNGEAVSLFGKFDAEISDFAIYKGINGAEVSAAIFSAGDGESSLLIHEGFVTGLNTYLPTVTLAADYVEAYAIALEDNTSATYLLDYESGDDYPSVAQPYSYAGSITVGNSRHGEAGAARFATDAEAVVHNLGFFGNWGVEGFANYVVDAREVTGTLTFTNGIIADNDAILGPVARPTDANNIPLDEQLVFSYNMLNNNGDGDDSFEDLEGNNYAGVDAGTAPFMYDNDTHVFDATAYQTDEEFRESGNPDANFTDWDEPNSDVPGTPGPFFGPVGDWYQGAVDLMANVFGS